VKDRRHSQRGAATVVFASLALCLLAGIGASVALGAKGDLHLVSRQSDADGGAGANSTSYTGSVSDNGRLVVFQSEATNLGPHGSGQDSVYVYDFKQHLIELASRQSASAGGLPAAGDARSAEISGSGRFVVFRTDAANLGGPIAADENIYVYDRETHRVQLVSRRSKKDGGKGANQNSDRPSISANGRYISYETRATNLGGPIKGDFEANVYVYDRKEKRTFLVSRGSHGGKGGNSNSFETSIAPSAPVVVFESQADNLGGPTKPTASANVYAYDWSRQKIELVSRRSHNGGGANDASDIPDVSANGRTVVFATAATNLGGPVQAPAGQQSVYVHDRKTGRTSLLSRQSKADGGQGADGQSGFPVISNSGQFVAFNTAATNLGEPGVSSGLNVYVYDREHKRAILASRATDGGPAADDYAAEPAIAGGGRFVAFYTPATNIDPPGEPAYHGNIPTASNVYRFQFAP
jgi:Tol biopolymer transport system component